MLICLLIQCTASRIGDNDSLNVQLEAVRANGICTMEMVQSLVVMVSKLNSEVQQPRIDNETMKTLRNLQQAPSHVPSTRHEVASSAIANKVTAKSYRDCVCTVGDNEGPDFNANAYFFLATKRMLI
jgi:hypothetical protein